jgi:hypothetical protein
MDPPPAVPHAGPGGKPLLESQEPGTPTPALEKEEKKRELPF